MRQLLPPSPMRQAEFIYLVSGMQFSLPFSLPGLEEGNGPALATFSTTLAPVAMPPPGLALGVGLGMFIDQDSVYMAIDQVGRFLANRQTGLTLDLEPGFSPLLLQQFLLGHIMGAMLHLHQILPLHASCLTRNGKTIAITAEKGSGKSTLAAALQSRGWRPLADDVTAVSANQQGIMLAWPGPPRFRLSPTSLEALNLPPNSGVSQTLCDKRLVTGAINSWHSQAAPLTTIIELVIGDCEHPQALPLVPPQSIAAIHAKIFRRRLVKALGLEQAHAENCFALARQTTQFTVVRSRDIAQLGHLVDLVEALSSP